MTANPALVLAEELTPVRGRSSAATYCPRSIWLSFVVIAGVLVMAIFGALLAPQSPSAQHLAIVNAQPSGAHWLGTDSLGRDVFSRVIAGSRDSAFFGPLVIAVPLSSWATCSGLFAGYRGGLPTRVIMRWVDFMWSLPALVILVVVAGAVGSSYWLAVVVLIVLTVPFDTRVIRGARRWSRYRARTWRRRKTLGVPRWKIMALPCLAERLPGRRGEHVPGVRWIPGDPGRPGVPRARPAAGDSGLGADAVTERGAPVH